MATIKSPEITKKLFGGVLNIDGAGQYSAELPIRIGGQWEIRSTVEWHGSRFCDRVRRTVEFQSQHAAESGQ